jgi:hypothetical protein
LWIEFTIVERQVRFADQAVANLRVEVISQHISDGKAKNGVQMSAISGIEQLHSRIFQPLALIEQLQHQGKHCAVEDMHVQPLKLRASAAPLANHRAPCHRHAIRTVISQTGGLDAGFVVRSWRLVS